MNAMRATGQAARSGFLVRGFLFCGILASVLYTAINIIVPFQYPGYDWRSQAVSELSAVGAPTRELWRWLCLPYGVLMLAFGLGLWLLGRERSVSLRWAGAITAVGAVVGSFWPPMHQREVLAAGGGTLTDTLHIAFTMIWGILSLATIAFAAVALDKGFRLFSGLVVLVLIGFSVLTSLEAPNMEANMPTPMMGAWERIGMAAYMLWVVVLAIALWPRIDERSRS